MNKSSDFDFDFEKFKRANERIRKAFQGIPKGSETILQEYLADEMISNIRKERNKTIRKLWRVGYGTYIVLIAIFVSCLVLYSTPDNIYINSRLIFASSGILTFIAIFYSILISKDAKLIFDYIYGILEEKRKDIDKRVDEKYKNSKDKTKDIKSINKFVDVETKPLRFIEKMIDLPTLLTLAVLFLSFSIIFSLFDGTSFILISYTFFSVGISFSVGIVFEWKLLNKEFGKRDIKTDKGENPPDSL